MNVTKMAAAWYLTTQIIGVVILALILLIVFFCSCTTAQMQPVYPAMVCVVRDGVPSICVPSRMKLEPATSCADVVVNFKDLDVVTVAPCR